MEPVTSCAGYLGYHDVEPVTTSCAGYLGYQDVEPVTSCAGYLGYQDVELGRGWAVGRVDRNVDGDHGRVAVLTPHLNVH